jgi:serine/threonine-protein kinase
MDKGSLPRSLALAASLAILGAGGVARAQPSPETRAAAAALFEDGKRLMGEGKYAEACPKLEESERIDPGMGTLFNLAVCFEQTNRTASAWVGFRDVAGMSAAAGLGDREKMARGRAAALEPRLMRLKITMAPAMSGAGIEVKRDGAVVSPALWGTPVPLDPGKHKVSASAPGKEPWEITVVLDQPGGVITVDVPPLLDHKPGAVAPPAGGPAAKPGGPVEAPPPPPLEGGASPRPWQRPVGITATVLGAVGLGVGTAFGFLGKSAKDASNVSNCDAKTNFCNAAGLLQRADAVHKGNIATGVFVAGAVLAAGGVVLWITAPSASSPKSAAWQRPELGVGPTGVAVRGGF